MRKSKRSNESEWFNELEKLKKKQQHMVNLTIF